MEKTAGRLHEPTRVSNGRYNKKLTRLLRRFLSQAVSISIFVGIWKLASNTYNSQLLLPTPESTFVAFYNLLITPYIWINLGITLKRVLTGFGCAMVLGIPMGLLMGVSKTAMDMLDPLLGSIRQVPIMAWIPLSIIWFGLGDGPTVFMIAMTGLFAVVLNTISGVHNISKDYYHAARSMGAGSFAIFLHVILPASIPDIMTGARLALSGGWMAVICAEFIATSAGFGFLMVEAQTRMETEKLLALMVMGALVGYSMDKCICGFTNVMARWKNAS